MAAKSKSKSRVSSRSQLTKFKFKWWMALILVGVVAILGIVILRFSYAGAGSSEAQIDQYFYYDNGYRDVHLVREGGFAYKTYRKNGQIGGCYFSPLTQEAVNSWNAYFGVKSTGNENARIILGRWYPSKKCV